jgi:predicted O-methyltransferase YrrM
MIKVESGKQDGTFADATFSAGVRLVQNTAVKLSVMLTSSNDRVKRRTDYATSESYKTRLRELGLSEERLWWGPMTISPRKIQFLLDEIEAQPPKRMLEVGSGTSTALFSAAGEKFGFDVLSLENHQRTIDYVQMLLQGLPCSRRVTIQKCSFVRRRYPSGERYRWYDANLEAGDAPFDFVFIDGPMGRLVGRNGALPEIKPYLSANHRIYLDDSLRTHENDCIKEWQRHYPELLVERPKAGRGVARIRLPEPLGVSEAL